MNADGPITRGSASEQPDERALYDRIRAWSDGTLVAEDVRRLEEALGADPELRLAAEEYRSVHRMTSGVPDVAPPSRLTFDDVSRALRGESGKPATTRRLRWGLAAAALVLLSFAAWLAFRAEEPTPRASVLELASIPADAIPADAGPSSAEAARLVPPLPASLAGYRPVAEQRIRWLASRDEARAVAAWTGRPVLVYVSYEGCPYCIEMDRTTLRDHEVLDLAERFVPLQVDAAKLSREAVEAIFQKGWPYFAVERADGVEIAVFPGRQDGPRFRERLAAALEGATGAPLPWDRVDAAASRGAILSARERSATDPAGALRDLETFAARLPGGPVADDVSLVIARWRSEGRFPDLRFTGAP